MLRPLPLLEGNQSDRTANATRAEFQARKRAVDTKRAASRDRCLVDQVDAGGSRRRAVSEVAGPMVAPNQQRPAETSRRASGPGPLEREARFAAKSGGLQP